MIRFFSVVLFLPVMLYADFSYSETTRMTGGSLMAMSRALGGFSKDMRKVGEPSTSSVFLKGNRMMHTSEHTAQITDLDNETITNIDFDKQTYSVITFAQMREAMQKAMERSKSRMNEVEARNPPPPTNTDTEVNWKMDIKETGKVQMISGVNAKEVLMIMTMEAKDKQSGQSGAMDTMSAIWVSTEKIPGYEELTAFHKRMAAKMASSFAASPFARQGMMGGMDPRFMGAMQNLAKEAEKLQGVHVKQITKMGSNLDPAKASEITDPSTMPQGPTAGDVAGKAASNGAQDQAARSISGRLGGLGGLGGFGGLGRNKKSKQDAPPPPPPDQQQQQAAASGVLMEMVMEMNNFSTGAVDPSKFAVPAGFKQVENPMLRMLKQ